MICSRGSTCTEREYLATTLATATKWFKGVTKEMLPITIKQRTATGGRTMIVVYDNKGEIVYTRG